ncbi:MAG: prepilin-type N-terminal cleavage/methylation domain-containing protein [Planctomycetaceae bacterium]|nr:prepilin-type N-terminal cleavage/methylation domain-containing protein [Planctomycetales bacterium]MCB9872773.1 prepilin-type N-terminal cleavage/methylation domain-containing protein [Planctomycetaceae bacterium]MCB9926259.1 prepilin-type N-terminal cleavage/methylation domain-containing protein [Planctomycetaceae bacterium]
MSRHKFQGFTLVEILIVVVIMAVLAAVVVPQFAGSTDDAKKSTAEFNLGSLRSVVQTFRAHHEGVKPAFPSGATTIEALTKETNAAGAVTTGGGFGPYLVSIPENPFTGKSTVAAVATAGTPPVSGDVTANNQGGWIYDASTGNIWLDSNTQGEFAW